MRLIATADWHMSQYSQDSIIPESGLPERLHSIKTVLNNIIIDSKRLKIDTIVVAGDVMHDKSIIHSIAQSVLLDFVRLNRDTHFYIIDGNHDLSSMSKGSGVSALKCLDNEPNVKMFHETTIIDNIMFAPWGKTMIDDIKKTDCDYLFSHFGVNEAELSNGMSLVADIKSSDLRKFKKVILGHYHKPQQLGNIYYCGSPIQLNWGEKNESKQYLIVDTDLDTVESVPTVGYNKYIELIITKDNKDEIVKQAKELKDEGHYVAIKRFSKDVEVDDIKSDIRVIDKSEVDVTNRNLDRNMSQREKLQRYVEVKEIPEALRELYVNMAINLINDHTENSEIEALTI